MPYKFKELYSGGDEIIGSDLPTYDGTELEAYIGDETETHVLFAAQFETPTIVRESVYTKVPLEQFGDAQPSDVRRGVTCTSSAGVTFEGTFDGTSGGGIVEVDQLPTENIDENVFYLVGGRYYRWHKTGTWVFKDNYLIPNEMLGKSYRCGFSVNTPSDGVQTMDKISLEYGQVITFMRERDSYYIEAAELGYWYNDIYKTITITEEPTDATFIAWLNDNAIPDGVWYKYVPTSIEDDIIGTWVFDDELSIPDNFYGNTYYFRYTVPNIPDEGTLDFSAIRFYDDGTKYIEYIDVDGSYWEVHQDGVGWLSDAQAFKTIKIKEKPDDESFIDWIRMNATKAKTSYAYSAIEIIDDEGYGPINVTYKVEENGNLVDKTKILPNSGSIKMAAPRGTEIFVNKNINCWAQTEQNIQINIEYRYADGGMYITVPDLDFCRITLCS